MIVLYWLELPQFVPRIAIIERLLPLTLKQIGTISSQPKFQLSFSEPYTLVQPNLFRASLDRIGFKVGHSNPRGGYKKGSATKKQHKLNNHRLKPVLV